MFEAYDHGLNLILSFNFLDHTPWAMTTARLEPEDLFWQCVKVRADGSAQPYFKRQMLISTWTDLDRLLVRSATLGHYTATCSSSNLSMFNSVCVSPLDTTFSYRVDTLHVSFLCKIL